MGKVGPRNLFNQIADSWSDAFEVGDGAKQRVKNFRAHGIGY
jgi:hypothetical protein